MPPPDEWNIDGVLDHLVRVVGLTRPKAVAEVRAALYSGELPLWMTTRDDSGAISWRGQLAASWYSGYLDLHVDEASAAKIIMTRGLKNFHQSTFTVLPRDVRRLWPASSNRAIERAAMDWLVAEISRSPDHQPRAREEYFKSLRQQFPKLSFRGFRERIWAPALKAVPNKWGRPGPKSVR
jgi:hypothetical protein